MKGYNIYLASKVVCYKLYRNLQSLPISTYYWKNHSTNFVIDFSFSINWKGNSYDIILVDVNSLMKMIYYELVKTMIDIAGLIKIIINVVIKYHSLLELILSDRSSLFTPKFRFLLYYFFDIKQNLCTMFYLQIDG